MYVNTTSISLMRRMTSLNGDHGTTDTFCFDCVYMHCYKINPCSHTICLGCLEEAIEEKIRLQQEKFICPRCTKSEKRRNRLHKQRNQYEHEPKQECAHLEQFKPEENCFNDERFEDSIVFENPIEPSSLWPDGTQSWHIHEIKPQRQSFASKPHRERFMATSQSENGYEPSCSEYNGIEPDRLYNEGLLNTTQLDNQLRKSRRTLEMTTGHTSNPSQHPNESNWSGRLNESLLSSRFSSNVRSHDRRRDQLLKLISTHIILLSLRLFSILVQIGIVHHPTQCNDFDQQFHTFEPIFTIDLASIAHSQHHLVHSNPFVKTVAILRNLESLLIYGIS